jgi:hypothetical protein
MLPCTEAWWLKHDTWHCSTKPHKVGKFIRNPEVTKGTLILSPKRYFDTISPYIVAWWLKHDTWHSLTMLHNLRKIGRNRGVTKGTLPLPPKQFFVSTSACIAAAWLIRQIWHSLTMLQNLHKFGRSREVMKGTLILRQKQFSSLSRIVFRRGDSNMRRNTPSPCATTYASLSKSGCNERHITLEPETVFLLYPAWFWSRVTQTWHVTLPHHAPQSM